MPGTCTAIATGGVIPRGADAVVMIEQTELVEESQPRIELRRAANSGQFVSYAGSDIARGETLLRHAPILLKKACRSSIRHVLPSRGNVSFCNIITTRRKAAALVTRTAIKVIGGISVTAISMKR